jgi:addiction module HigA family antidote
MVTKNTFYNPNIAIHPGVTLKDELDFLQLSQKELALKAELSEKHISQILSGEANIGTETALKLERVIGVRADFWNEKQRNYDLTVARLREKERIKVEVPQAKKFSVYNELVKLGAVNPTKDWGERTEQLLNLFKVSSIRLIPQVQGVRYRKSEGEFDEYALSAWLQCGELQARGLSLTNYDKKAFKKLLPELKRFTSRTDNFFPELQELCAAVGVAVVYTPYFPKSKVNGAVRWLGNNPLIQINSKGVAADRFWFTFYHEAGHIILHGKSDRFLEYNEMEKSNEEQEADVFAANMLLESKSYQRLVAGSLTEEAVHKVAQYNGVDVGVVVGRLAYEGIVDWRTATKYGKRINLPLPVIS